MKKPKSTEKKYEQSMYDRLHNKLTELHVSLGKAEEYELESAKDYSYSSIVASGADGLDNKLEAREHHGRYVATKHARSLIQSLLL